MSRAKYPIYLKPSKAFMKKLDAVRDSRLVVTELVFIQWTPNRFGAEWRHGEKGKTFTMEMSLGGAEPSLEAIKARVLEFLKVDATV
jgi:hypothetical protein